MLMGWCSSIFDDFTISLLVCSYIRLLTFLMLSHERDSILPWNQDLYIGLWSHERRSNSSSSALDISKCVFIHQHASVALNRTCSVTRTRSSWRIRGCDHENGDSNASPACCVCYAHSGYISKPMFSIQDSVANSVIEDEIFAYITCIGL